MSAGGTSPEPGPRWLPAGFVAQELLEFGPSGEVWRARDDATGETVALQRLHPEAGPDVVAACRQAVTTHASLSSPHLVRLRAVLEDVLVLDHCEGGSLAALLAVRRVLPAGEVVTVAVPVASALAEAHAAGLVHGRVAAAAVRFDATGKPLLADLALPVLPGARRAAGALELRAEAAADLPVGPPDDAGAAAGPAGDVRALAALCHLLLTGAEPGEEPLRRPVPEPAPTRLAAAVAAALSGDPARRPDAAAFGAELRAACPAVPVRLVAGSRAGPTGGTADRADGSGLRGAGAGSRPRRSPRAGRQTARTGRPAGGAGRRRGLLLPGALLLLGLAGAFAVRGSGSDEAAPRAVSGSPPAAEASTEGARVPEPAGPSSPPLESGAGTQPLPVGSEGAGGPGPGDDVPLWREVLDELDRRRERAFATADPAVLRQVYADPSAALAGDDAAVRGLAAAGRAAAGVRHEVLAAVPTDAADDRVTLRVVDTLQPHAVVGAGGQVLEQRPGRGERASDVVLVRSGAEWRLLHVEVAP